MRALKFPPAGETLPPRLRLLHLLERELEFLRSGGYRRAQTVPWRPAWIFLDSPVCRKGSDGVARSCAGCPLLYYVAAADRRLPHPCYSIAVASGGRTLGELQRAGYLPKLEAVMETWLLRALDALTPAPAPVRSTPPRREPVTMLVARPAAA